MEYEIGAVEKNIYVEERSGAFRFTVQVSPFPGVTQTFRVCDYEKGRAWARGICTNLTGKKERTGLTTTVNVVVAEKPSSDLMTPDIKPGQILVRDALKFYRENELSGLSGEKSAGSRLTKLDGWFGPLTVSELKKHFLNDWTERRLAGVFGSGRGPAVKQDERLKAEVAESLMFAFGRQIHPWGEF